MHGVVGTVGKWISEVHNNKSISKPTHQLAVSDCTRWGPGSTIEQTGYLHLRTVWYCYKDLRTILPALITDDTKTDYKGFVTPQVHSLAESLVNRASSGQYALKYYLDEVNKPRASPSYLRPEPECGHFYFARLLQALTVIDVNEDLPLVSKVSTPATPPRKTAPAPKAGDGSHSLAPGGAANPPSADEAYPNFALLILLQALCLQFGKSLPSMYWHFTR